MSIKLLKKYSPKIKLIVWLTTPGITSFKAAEDNSISEINDIIKTNLLGGIYAIKHVLPDMIKRKNGTIINILSIAVKEILTNGSAYTASKMGLQGYSDVLREEVRKHNIRIINVTPGATDTPMWSLDVRKENSERMMTSEDVARTIVWAYLQEGNMVNEEIVIRPITGDL